MLESITVSIRAEILAAETTGDIAGEAAENPILLRCCRNRKRIACLRLIRKQHTHSNMSTSKLISVFGFRTVSQCDWKSY